VNGVATGIVVSLDDPEGLSRVRVSYPWMHDSAPRSYWARIAAPMAGPDRGLQYMPELGDEVLVAFDQGNLELPYIIGFLWNHDDRPPTADPQLRLLRSVNGHEIAVYDPDVREGDKGYICLKDAHGNVIKLGNAQITITCTGTLLIEAPNVIINGRLVAPQARPI
jgi:phage baseplate assembly protein gpV